MRKKIFLLLFLVVIFGCSPKITLVDLESSLKEYSRYISKKEFVKAISFMPNECWDVYKKEDILNGIIRADRRAGGFELRDLKIQNVSKTLESDKKHFKVITYSGNIVFNYSNLSQRFVEKQKESFGEENVHLDSINNRMTIKSDRQMITIFDKDTRQWKFIEADPEVIVKVYGFETYTNLLKYIR